MKTGHDTCLQLCLGRRLSLPPTTSSLAQSLYLSGVILLRATGSALQVNLDFVLSQFGVVHFICMLYLLFALSFLFLFNPKSPSKVSY